MLKFLTVFGVIVTIIVSVATSENHFNVETIQKLYDRAISFQNKYNFGLINSKANGRFEEQYEHFCSYDNCYLHYRVLNNTYLDDLHEGYKIENNKFKTLKGELLHRSNWDVTNKYTRYNFEKTDTGFRFDNANSDDTDNVRSFSISNHDLSDNLQTSFNLSDESKSFVNDLMSFHRKMIDFLNSLSAEDNHVFYFRFNSDDGNIVHIEFRDNENRNDGTISFEVHSDGRISGKYIFGIQTQSFTVENGKTVLQGTVQTTGAYK